MMRNKKKVILIVLMIALLLIGAVGGTVAYLKDQTEKVENVFQPARVPSEVIEGFDGSTKTNVQIKNNGNVPAYIRAAIVVTWKDEDGHIYPKNPVEEADYTLEGLRGSDWSKNGSNYYYYTKEVEPNGLTSALFTKCEPVEGRAPEGYSLNVEIIGQAIQSKGITGMTGWQDAWTKAAENGSTAN